jgi:hypothetical protein
MTLLFTEALIRELPLSVVAAVPVMETAFRCAGEGSAENAPRRGGEVSLDTRAGRPRKSASKDPIA